MLRCLGNANAAGFLLRYYILGNLRDGYRIRITESGGTSPEQSEQYISRRPIQAVRLVFKLRRCSVFPENLSEILDDIHCEKAGQQRRILEKIPFARAGEKIRV